MAMPFGYLVAVEHADGRVTLRESYRVIDRGATEKCDCCSRG